MRKTFIYTLAIALSIVSCMDNRYYIITGYAQGGTYSIKYQGADIPPDKLKPEIDSLLQVIEHTLSGYDKSSDLSRLNSADTIILSPMFAKIYELSYDVWKKSDGAFDVASGPLFNIWGFGFTSQQFPSDKDIKECLKKCGTYRLKTPEEINLLIGHHITAKDFLKKGETVSPLLNFNAIAQGFSCDLIAELLRSHGVNDMLVDIGEIYCCGCNPEGKGWTIGIDNPVDGNNSPGTDIRQLWNSQRRDCGIVTSGNYRKYYIKDGKKYSHTIDPRTGYPVSHNLLSATVIAPDATQADALATVFMVRGLDYAKSYISNHPELQACLISSEGVWNSWE